MNYTENSGNNWLYQFYRLMMGNRMGVMAWEWKSKKFNWLIE